MQNPKDYERNNSAALDLIGGEPLAGSGFEGETPESGFDRNEPDGDGGR